MSNTTAAIVARMGLDASGYKRDTQDVVNTTKASARQMEKSFDGVGNAQESLFKGQRKLKSEAKGLAGGLAQCQSAADALNMTLGHLSSSLNLGILGGAAVAGGVMLISQFTDAYDAAKKFNEEVAAIGIENSPAEFRSLAFFEQRIDAIQSKLKEFQKDPGLWKSLGLVPEISNTTPSEADRRSNPESAKLRAFLRNRDAQIDALQNELERARKNVAKKAAGETEIMRKELEGDKLGAELLRIQSEYAEKKGKAMQDGNKNPELYKELKLQQQIAEESAKRGFGKGIEEQMSKESDIFLKEKKKQTDAAEKLEDDLNKQRAADLKKQIEDGNKLYLKDLDEKKKAAGKKREEDEKAEKSKADRLAAYSEQAAENAKNARAASIQQKVDDLSTPGGKSARRRKERRDEALLRRAIREQELEDRGGQSKADAEKDKRPISERTKPKEEFGPKETLPEREARLRRIRGEQARQGMSKGRGGDEFKDALDSSVKIDSIKTSLGNIEKNLRGAKL